jgi:methionyl aminopeptidase
MAAEVGAVAEQANGSPPAAGAAAAAAPVSPAGVSDDDEAVAAPGDSHDKPKKARKRKSKKAKKPAQTSPPSVLVSQLFPNNSYPAGEEVDYTGENLYRTTDEEKRYLDKNNAEFLSDYRQAAETHRQVRQWAQKSIRPGQSLIEVAEGIEDSVRRLLGHDGLTEGDSIKGGMGFPTGLNLDNIAAHVSPNAGNKTILQQNNVLKVDIGVHVNGRIVDSAFTMAFDPTYDNLLAAVKAATNTGVREAGIDVRLGELGGLIQETMESYECEINGTMHPIKPIRDLAGHTIVPYSIHGTKSVPIVKTSDTTKMEEGDVFAIETFGTTGTGLIRDGGEVSHYALRRDAPKVDLPLISAKSVLKAIQKNFSTIPFCRRYLDRIGQERYLLGVGFHFPLTTNSMTDTRIAQQACASWHCGELPAFGR